MSEENKTAEETTILDLAIQEIEKQKFNLNVHKLPATKVGLTDALNVLEYLKEEHYIKCECGHIVEHKFSHTNEDGQVTCSLCVIAQQQEINAELIKEINILKRQIGAYKVIKDSQEKTIVHYSEKAKDITGAIATLDSEREMNAVLTNEVEELKKQKEELVEALKNAKNDLQWTWDNMGKPHTSDHFNIPANGIHQIEEVLSKHTT